jgi:hypothetical protein
MLPKTNFGHPKWLVAAILKNKKKLVALSEITRNVTKN